MKIGARQADGFCRAPDDGIRAILVYGADSGLVRERSDLLASSVLDDLADPFRMAELQADDVASDPARLVDEAGAIALTGGRRVVRVKGARDSLTDAVTDLLAHPTGDTLVVIEARELQGRSKLRALLEKAKDGAAVACYRDEGRSLEQVITDELSRQGVSAERDAVQLLTAFLGGDRRQTRAEVAKLALYVGEGNRATTGDVEAVVADSSFLSMDRIAHAVSGGRLGDLDRSLERALADREQPVTILGAVRRHMTQLQLFLSLREHGMAEGQAVKAAKVFHFRAEDALKAGARCWTSDRARRALGHLTEAEIQCKTTGMPAETLCRRALFDLARAAHAAGRR